MLYVSGADRKVAIEQARAIAHYIINGNCSILEASKSFSLSNQTMSVRLKMLKDEDPDLYNKVKKVLGPKFDAPRGKGNFEEKERKFKKLVKTINEEREAVKMKNAKPKKKRIPKYMYKSVSGRVRQWPNLYKVTAKNVLLPGETQTLHIRAKDPMHAFDIYMIIRNHYGYRHLSSDIANVSIEEITA